jgi:hypothetical protein
MCASDHNAADSTFIGRILDRGMRETPAIKVTSARTAPVNRASRMLVPPWRR